MNTIKNHYRVVAAVVCQNGKILTVRKGKTRFAYTSGKWEFPGGKVEAGETEPEALRRELKEELDIEVKVERLLMTVDYEYPDFSIALSTYCCTTDSLAPNLREHTAFHWLKPSELHELDWADADKAIVQFILNNPLFA